MSRHDNQYRGGRDQRFADQQDQFAPRSHGGGQQGGFSNPQRGFGGGQQGDWHGGGTGRFGQPSGYSPNDESRGRGYRDDGREIGGAYGLRHPRDRGPGEQDYGGAQDNFGGAQSAGGYDRGASNYASSDDWQQRGYGGGGSSGGLYGDYRLDRDDGGQGWRDQQGRSQHRHEFEPDYHQWRKEQVQALDEDYRNWRQERYKKFSDEFSDWRKNRSSASSASATGSASGENTQTPTKNK
jgi:hypothetical protein